MKGSVAAAAGELVVVGALLGDVSLVHDDNEIGLPEGREAVALRKEVWPRSKRWGLLDQDVARRRPKNAQFSQWRRPLNFAAEGLFD